MRVTLLHHRVKASRNHSLVRNHNRDHNSSRDHHHFTQTVIGLSAEINTEEFTDSITRNSLIHTDNFIPVTLGCLIMV